MQRSRSRALALALLLPLAAAAADVVFPPVGETEARAIADVVMRNETGGDPDKLVWWNPGEAFPSVGIGHFIWYPRGVSERFEESFPRLLRFAAERGVALPAWLAGDPAPPCPWPDRTAFLAARDDPRRIELARWLRATTSLQARFLVARIEASVPRIVDAAEPARRAAVARRIERLAGTRAGRLALVDYVNFKGTGLSPRERYAGEGWGLAQALDAMGDGPCPARALGDAALAVLERRVRNAPPERRESRWLPGWRARVAAYGADEPCAR